MLSTAYWIAFGPHGPRAEDPPGTNARIAWGVTIGVAASVAIFGAIRLAAKPAPYTMTQEYQEESNEFLKVCIPLSPASPASFTRRRRIGPPMAPHMLTRVSRTGPSRQPRHRHLLRRLHRQGRRPVSPQERLSRLIKYARRTLSFPFVLEECVDRGKNYN